MFDSDIKKNFIFTALSIFVAVIIIFYLNKYLNLGDNKEQIATKVYFVDNISDAHVVLIDKFNMEYDGKIEIVPVNLPFAKFSTNERKELLARSLRSKNDGIDIFAVDLIWVPRFIRWGEPLDLYFPINERERIIKPALESCYFNEKFVSAPFYIDVGLMYYRDDIIKDFSDYDQIKAKLDRGITWQELIALKKEKDHLSNPFYLFAGKDFEGLVCSFIEGLMSQDSLHFYKDTINLNTSVARKSLQLLVDLIHKYKLTPEVVTKFDEVNIYRYALKNDAIFFRGWPGLHWHEDPPEDIYKLKYIKMTHLPHFKGKSIRSVYGGWNLMISKFSQKKHEALIFIKFLLKEENQKLMYENGGLIPVNKNVYSDSLFMHKNLILKKYKKLLEKGGHRPFRVDYTRISDILSYYIHRALKKEISVNEALNKATNKINSQESMVY